MISTLSIENFALIDSVTINFNSGFTVITGETGSGKSILLNALNLILGERANFSVIGNRGDKSVVEAEIDISGFEMKRFFDRNELDYFDQTIVRREIHKQGRSRAFINDTPVQLTVLKELTSQLIHIHSQYNTLELKDVQFQLKVLDVLAGTLKERSAFSKGMNAYVSLTKELEKKKLILSESLSQSDYNTFQLNELKALNLDQLDYEMIQSEAQKGEYADEIRIGFGDIQAAISGDGGAQDQLNTLRASLAKKISYDPLLQDIHDRVSSVLIELEDIAGEAEAGLDKIEFDPRKLDELIAQLDAYNRILQKHGKSTQEELKMLMSSLAESSESHEQTEVEIEQLTAEVEKQLSQLKLVAAKLHAKRMKAIPKIEKSIKSALSELKLENTELSFRLEEGELNAYGNSKLEILFSPNAGVAAVPVHQAASGGELSRVMLALQSLMSSRIQLQTILFDEIDTGVSGDVAQKMGNTLKKMGEGMQVIAITHLPQVAAKGGQHFKVAKKIIEGKTTTSVVELSDEERVEETARLMSGDEINTAALENAKSLMG